MDNCIFCQMLTGNIPTKKVYEDEHCIGVLDIYPAHPGHVILVSKEHQTIMPQLKDEVVEDIAVVAKHMSQRMLNTLGVKGTNIYVANGIAAGQKAGHVLVHVIPRSQGDNVMPNLPTTKLEEKEKMIALLK